MPAFSSVFPWPSYYGHFNFFESRMREHSRVASITSLGHGVYALTLKSGKSLRAFVCECYSFGVAEYTETVATLGKLDVIIVDSNWCGYTSDAKRQCRYDKVGLFKVVDFMAALNTQKFWLYLTKAEAEKFEEEGWL